VRTRRVLDLADQLFEDVLEEDAPAWPPSRRTTGHVQSGATHRRERVLELGVAEQRDELADPLRRHRLRELLVLEIDDVLEVHVPGRLPASSTST
jgi:hypothetical protein